LGTIEGDEYLSLEESFMKRRAGQVKTSWILASVVTSVFTSMITSGIVASVLSNAAPAQAQAAYGSYIGIGPSIGLTEGGGKGRQISGVITGRYKFLEAPISGRAQVFIGDGVSIVPTVSYDIPLNWQTDAYIGLGAAIPLGGVTPVGDRTAFVIQPGIDYALPNSNMVVYGNAVIAFDAYKDTRGTAAALQGGVGLRF
jgi:hypothetical protein